MFEKWEKSNSKYNLKLSYDGINIDIIAIDKETFDEFKFHADDFDRKSIESDSKIINICEYPIEKLYKLTKNMNFNDFEGCDDLKHLLIDIKGYDGCPDFTIKLKFEKIEIGENEKLLRKINTLQKQVNYLQNYVDFNRNFKISKAKCASKKKSTSAFDIAIWFIGGIYLISRFR